MIFFFVESVSSYLRNVQRLITLANISSEILREKLCEERGAIISRER
jgi:hypothetical protein